jgi:glucokinase
MAGERLCLGIEVRPAQVQVALVDKQGQLRDLHAESFTALPDTAALLAIIERYQSAQVAAIGISVPRADSSATALAAELQQTLGIPVQIDNPANSIVYAEWQSRGRQIDNLVYVHIDSTISAGIILQGQLYRGGTGCAGEIGHITINVDGTECQCGNIGCLDTVASSAGIVRRAQQRLYRDRTSSLARFSLAQQRPITAEDIAQAARQGDELSQVVLERTGRYIGIALGSVINLLNPQMVILGGKMMVVGELLRQAVVDETQQRTLPSVFNRCQIVSSQLNNAAIVGAALLARDAAMQAGDRLK